MNRRKSDQPVKLWKFEIPQKVFKFFLVATGIILWLVFNANFELKTSFFSCGTTPQNIPGQAIEQKK